MNNPFVVYVNNNIELRNLNNVYYVKAISPIKAGTILLVERGLVQTKHAIARCLYSLPQLQPYILDLYPRNTDLSETSLNSKIDHNCWDWEQNYIGLFFNLSKFNHSCCPNAFFMDFPEQDGISSIKPIVLVSICDIEPNEEICIMYNSDAGHNSKIFDWKCFCEISDKARSGIFSESIQLAKLYIGEQTKYIEPLLRTFKSTDELSSDRSKSINEQSPDRSKSNALLLQIKNYFETLHELEQIDNLSDGLENMSINRDTDFELNPDPRSEMMSYAIANFDEGMIEQMLDQNVPIEEYDVPHLCCFIKQLCNQSQDYDYLYHKLVRYAKNSNNKALKRYI